MTGKKVLIEVTELTQGGFVAKEIMNPGSGVKPRDPIYAEKLNGKLGLINRIGKRLIEIFKP